MYCKSFFSEIFRGENKGAKFFQLKKEEIYQNRTIFDRFMKVLFMCVDDVIRHSLVTS